MSNQNLVKNTNTGGPAFPSHGSMGEVVCEGLSLRDYFAAKAMQGDSGAGEGWAFGVSDEIIEKRVELYWRIADAMLKARES